MIDTYDGVRVEINKQLSPWMLINHNFWLGTSMIPNSNRNYQFSCQVASDDGVLIGRLDHNLGVEGTIIRQRALSPNVSALFKGVLVASKDKEGGNDQFVASTDLSGPSWSVIGKVGSMAGGNAAGVSYVQSVTSSFALGAEMFYLGSKDVAIGSYGARYVDPSSKWLAAAQWTGMQQSLGCCYKRTVTKDRVNLAAELNVSPASGDTSANVGAEFTLRNGRVAMALGGDGGVKSVLETTLQPGVKINFSAEINHFTDTYRFGYGINMG